MANQNTYTYYNGMFAVIYLILAGFSYIIIKYFREFEKCLNSQHNFCIKINTKINEYVENLESNLKNLFEKKIYVINSKIDVLDDFRKKINTEQDKSREKLKITVERIKNLESRYEQISSNNNQHNEKIVEINTKIYKLEETIINISTHQEDPNKNINKPVYYETSDNEQKYLNLIDSKFSQYLDKFNTLNSTITILKEKILQLENHNSTLISDNKDLKSKLNNIVRDHNSKIISIQRHIKNEQNTFFAKEIINNLIEDVTINNTKNESIKQIQENIDQSIRSNEFNQSNESNELNQKIISLKDINDLSFIFYSKEKDRLIHDIEKLIIDEIGLFNSINLIRHKFSLINPNFTIPVPEGFNTFYFDIHGQPKFKNNTLHLLSNDYINTNKLIEIVFARYFFDKIDINTFYFYYINDQPAKSLLLYKFDIKSDIPIIPPDSIEFLILEIQCLRGIYYVFNNRKFSLERFLTAFGSVTEKL